MRIARIAWSIAVLLTVCAATQALDPIAILSPSDVPAGWSNGFGLSAAVSGDYIAVGAPQDPYYNDQQTGAVYVFRRHGPAWIQQVKLTVPSEMWDGFGDRVAIDGDILVASAPQFDQECVDCHGPGAVYVFRRDDHGTPDDPTDDTWPLETKLNPPVPREGDIFGFSVAIDGGVIVVGQYGSRKAEVFRWAPAAPGGWVHEGTLMGDTPGEGFGYSVDIDGDRIIVGSPDYNDRRGRALLFLHDQGVWVEDGRVQGKNPAPIDDFARSVSISGDYAVVGAPHDDDVGTNAGAAYVFFRRGPGDWVQQSGRLGLSDTRYLLEFGYAVAVDRDLVAVAKIDSPRAVLYRRMYDAWERVDSFPLALGVALDGNFAAPGNVVYAVRDQRSLRDYAAFQKCFTGTMQVDLSPTCHAFDLTGDGRVDLGDFEDFVGTFVGP